MQPSYLGKILLRWCDSCNVPVLSGHCACGAPTRAVPVTPPGDARPAFPYDIALINRIYEDYFGAPLIPDGHIALINKVPDADRMEEIVVGGAIVGAIRYLPLQQRWEPLPRTTAGLLMQPTHRYVVVDDGAVPSIRKQGASVLAPGLTEIDASVRRGDEVFILSGDGECIGVGRAKVDADEAADMKRGSIVRTRKNVSSVCVPGTADWEDAVIANAEVIERAENASVCFIRDTVSKYKMPVNVSYSGGKDSLATLLLVMKAIGKVPLLFIDTGLELPETYENIRMVAEEYGLSLVNVGDRGIFWEMFARRGPPSVNARWCCTACKLEPVSHLIRDQWGECLSFIGQRKYESLRRMKSRRIWRNSRVKNQLSASPIQNWTAMHVWLYLFRENAPYNELYRHGLDRIGCYMCPSSDMAQLCVIRDRHPEIWQDWQNRLQDWSVAHGMPTDWVETGLWRKSEGSTDEEDCYY